MNTRLATAPDLSTLLIVTEVCTARTELRLTTAGPPGEHRDEHRDAGRDEKDWSHLMSVILTAPHGAG